MADIVLYHVPHYEKAQEHSHAGKHKVRQAAAGHYAGKPALDCVDGNLQEHGGHTAKKACQDRQAK